MSVAGVSPGSTEAAAPRAVQPVAPYNPATGAAVTPASAAPDGSQPISGADGTSRASLVNPAPVVAEVQFNTTRPTLPTGSYAPLQATNRGAAIVAIGDISTSVATLLGGSTDGNSVAATGLVTFGYNAFFNTASSLWDRMKGDAGGVYVVRAPSLSANAALAPIASVATSGVLLKSSAGNLYSASMVAGATAGFFILYNATAVPAGGAALTAALTLLCVPVAANGFASIGGNPLPVRCTAGVVLLFSTSATTYTVPANLAVHVSGSYL